MEEEHTNPKLTKDLETKIFEKVGDTISSINKAKHVDEVICSLYSLAILLFPFDPSLLSGSLDVCYRDQVLNVVVPSISESEEWRGVFYRGSAFPTLARVLIYNVASSWLACFPLSARKYVYDAFFLEGPLIEVVEAVIPGLIQHGRKTDDIDFNAVCSNAERILVLCLLEKDGIHQMARDFGDSGRFRQLKPDSLIFISRVSQQVASIPDKARIGAPAALSSHSFFKRIVIQLIAGAEEKSLESCSNTDSQDRSSIDGTFLFVGETFARICRRGSADILAVEIIPRILELVRRHLLSSDDSMDPELVQSDPSAQFWMKMPQAIKDSYATERMAEHFLHILDVEHASDVEAYWCLWILFHQTFTTQSSMRSMFVDKFLLWKIFPIRCLRWILQFSVLECPPSTNELVKGQHTQGLLDRVQCMVKVWSKNEFVQKASMEQQAYVTAIVGLLMEKMTKSELEGVKDVMHSILQGVSCRLESPIYLVRRMASSIALVFSKVIDPNNPLYLDDMSSGEEIDWEFGLARSRANPKIETNTSSKSMLDEKVVGPANVRKLKHRNKNLSEFKMVDPDEIVDPAMLNTDHVSDDDDDSEDSEMSDSSLQPYDLSDDDTDLKKKFAQLVDVVGALRKPDDPDGVERALEVAENLVRASPDELKHLSGDLVRALVQVRCSDLAVEEEEETAEERRQKALTAVVATCPFESLDAINKLLYSPNVDISQRILILDTMTDAAQELADSRCIQVKLQQKGLISTISETQPWFLPSSRGPIGAGLWKEVSESETPLSWSHRYERDLPLRPSQIKAGKSRRWSLQSSRSRENSDLAKNRFPIYAAAFMLPAMQGFDKKRHGVDLLGADFIVLGKLIHMLGMCIKCTALHPEASALAPHFLDMLSSREVSHHAEAYVRRSVLFAASCILIALHPSFVASALAEGNSEISNGLEWIRTWALHIAESDTDNECSSMAMACLQLHSELALQASRALETTDYKIKEKGVTIPSIMTKGSIKIAF
ncbi:hypothetical protein ACHQM5_010781 [Ranunculus cassubicifolius]